MQTDPSLLKLLRRAAQHVMTPAEVRAQKLSWIRGMTGRTNEEIIAVLPELADDTRREPPSRGGEGR